MGEARHALERGYTIEGYRIERVLGAGGFGVTYLATEVAIARSVAIKEYLPHGIAARSRDNVSVQPLTSADRENFQWGLERFRREAQTLVSFHHSNIVAVFRYFEANGTAYLVMAYEDGESLAAILEKRKRLPDAELRALLTPLLAGLGHVHKAGFLHRDIKPGNIYVRRDGSPVLLDFGAARLAVGGRSQSLTSIVSAGYAPFEQYTTRGHQGPWTDIYAMGGVLYRAVAGERPPDAPDRIRDDPYVPAAKAAKKGYSAGLLVAIDAALIVDESKRPQSLAQWLPIFDGAPWPPPDEPTGTPRDADPELATSPPDATLAVGSPSLRPSVQRSTPRGRDDHTRWPEGAPSRTAPTAPPVASGAATAARSGFGKWVIVGGAAAVVLALAGTAALILVPGAGPRVAADVDTPAEKALRDAKLLLVQARDAIRDRNFASAESMLAQAEAIANQHNLADVKQEIAAVRAELERAREGERPPPPPPPTAGDIPPGSWPADAELRRAVEDTIRKVLK